MKTSSFPKTIPSAPRLVRQRPAMRCVSALLTVLFVFVATPVIGQLTYTQIKSFGLTEEAGRYPRAGVIESSDGFLYGTTTYGGFGGHDTIGGSADGGIIYRVRKDGTDFAALKFFGPDDGFHPWAPLIEGSDGVLYGTTFNPSATFFRVNRDGTGYTVLKREVAGNSAAALLEGSDGALYGTIIGVGVFRLSRDGAEYAILRNLNGNSFAPLIEGSDGVLYGTTRDGGAFGYGTVFRLNKDGSEYAVIKHFGGTDGGVVWGGVIEGSDGVLYGTTTEGGDFNRGTIFSLNKDGSGFTVLRRMVFGEAMNPYASLLEGSDGALYGTSYDAGPNAGRGTVFKINKDGSGFAPLKTFAAAPNGGGGLAYPSGMAPHAALIKGTDGKLYGATYAGGAYFAGGGVGEGVLFRIGEDGSDFAVLWSFANRGRTYAPSVDGSTPEAAVIEGSDGALYGTTTLGGGHGLGTVFRVNRDGSGSTLLKSFNGGTPSAPGDGWLPYAPLLEASDGRLYGMCSGGGTAAGTLFGLNKDGSGFSLLTRFADASFVGDSRRAGLVEGPGGTLYGSTYAKVFRINKDGSGLTFLAAGLPEQTGVMADSNGTLYGTTTTGGASGHGALFRLNADGSGLLTLRSFSMFAIEGAFPAAPPTEGSDGALYGTTSSGIYRIKKDGSEFAVLRRLTSSEGGSLVAVTEGADGVLYGTASTGGAFGQGTLFRLNLNGSGFEVLKHFAFAPGEPRNPRAPLFRAHDGALFGTTTFGGDADLGTIFKLSTADQNPPLPDVTILPVLTDECSVTITHAPTATDDSSGRVVGTTSDPLVYTAQGTYTVTWRYEDNAGNTSTQTQVVVVKDTMAPVPDAASLPTVIGQCSATIAVPPTATDHCAGQLTGTTTHSLTYTMQGTYSVVWQFDDGNGNVSSQTQIVIVQDTGAPQITCPANISVGCSVDFAVPLTFSVTATDDCDPSPTVTCIPASGSLFPIGTTQVNCMARDHLGNESACSFFVTRAPLEFAGFLPPIGGADVAGGSFGSPVRTFKMGSTIPVKFTASCGGSPVVSGLHRLQVIKYTDATTYGDPIDASPQGSASTGDRFAYSDGVWAFKLETKETGMSAGIWLFVASLSDGSQHSVWIQLK